MGRNRTFQPSAATDVSSRVVVPERTPEQIALIALQSLLEAREAHIEKLEADARAAKVANERKLAGLEESCHAKIKAVRQGHSEQMTTVEAEASGKAQEACEKIAVMTEDLQKALLRADDALHELQNTQNAAADLRSQLGILKIQHENLLQEHEALIVTRDSAEEGRKLLEEELHVHMEDSARAVEEMKRHLQQLKGTIRVQQQEIDALQKTVEMQCRERLLLQGRLALQHQDSARTQVSDVPSNESVLQKLSDASRARYEEIQRSRMLLAKKKRSVTGLGAYS